MEDWRPIPNYPGYEASDDGRVRSWRSKVKRRAGEEPRLASPIVLKAYVDNKGYTSVTVRRSDGRTTGTPVHKLVITAFKGPKPTPRHEVAHEDGNRQNPAVENLTWKTHAENEADKARHGTRIRGERMSRQVKACCNRGADCYNAKLSEDAVRQIRANYGFVTTTSLASMFGVSRRLIRVVAVGNAWADVAATPARGAPPSGWWCNGSSRNAIRRRASKATILFADTEVG